MSFCNNFFRSLLLTSILSFAAPVLLLGLLLASLFLLSNLPFVNVIGQSCAEQVVNFLIIFGSGYPFKGILVIGLTCSLVGALFDVYAFYRYQILREN